MNSQTDLTKLKRLQSRILARKGLIGCGDDFSVALHNCGKLMYAGTDRWGQETARAWTGVSGFICGRDHIVALLTDGTLRLSGRCAELKAFTRQLSCVRVVSFCGRHIAALVSNGRVVAKGDDRYGQCHTENWPSVTDVVCGKSFTVGLTDTGHIVIAGGSRSLRHTVRAWKQIAGIFTDYDGRAVYAITAEGKLRSSRLLPRSVYEWKNLVFVAVNQKYIWGITAAGQILSTDPIVGKMSTAKHYISCAVSNTHVLALSKDGLVLSQGLNDFGQCNTARFGALFPAFEEFLIDRRVKNGRMEEYERSYQRHLVEALRYKKRMTCGERLTACINADGRVLTSANLPECHRWQQVRALSSGTAHLLALHENGTVSAAGNNVDGCLNVSEWRNVKSVIAGTYHSIGLTEDGRVLFCGRNHCGRESASEWTGIRRLYASDDYVVGVTYGGEIRIAGTPPFDPEFVQAEWRDPVDMVATPTHMVALLANGCVVSTDPACAQADTGNVTVYNTHEWENIHTIAAGRGFTVGLCYGGRVVAAGCNEYGQCDTDDWTHIVDIGCGDTYTVGLTADGRVLYAGKPLGGYATVDPETKNWQSIMAIRCGVNHMVALTRSGQLVAYGHDEDGCCSAAARFTLFRDARQLYGYGQYSRQLEKEIRANQMADSRNQARNTEESVRTGGSSSLPKSLQGSFAIGMAHHVRLDASGRIEAFGANDCGQCDVRPFETALQVAAGPYRSAAILPNGHVVLAGRNSDGQADARVLNIELNSADLVSGHTWVQVACGNTHTVALRSDGRVFAIGANPDGRCDTQRWREVTQVSCGIRHTVARKSDGSCLAAGENHYGQCDLSRWTDISMVAAGEFHTVGLTADGRVVAVGDNRKGQCDVEDLRNMVAVACLPEATVCVGADGHVVIRGGSGELNAAVEVLRDVVAVDTCEYRIAAMTASRELVIIP